MPHVRTLLALASVTLCTAGCYADDPVFLQNPVTGATATCNSNSGNPPFLVTQFTGDRSAIRACTARYEAEGFTRIN